MTDELRIMRKDDVTLSPEAIASIQETMRWAGTAHADRMGAPRVARPGLVALMTGKFLKLKAVDQATIDSPAKVMSLPKNRYIVIPEDSLGRAKGSPEESIRLWMKKWLPGIPSTAYAIVRVPILD